MYLLSSTQRRTTAHSSSLRLPPSLPPSLPHPTPPLLASFALLGESDGNGLLLAPLAARSGRHLGLGPWLALEPTCFAQRLEALDWLGRRAKAAGVRENRIEEFEFWAVVDGFEALRLSESR